MFPGFVRNVTAGRLALWSLAVLLLLPVLFIGLSLVLGEAGESWPHVREFLLGEAIQNTLILIVGVGVLTLFLGLPAAWCVARYDFFGRKFFSVLLVLPLAVPPYIASYVTTDLREYLTPHLITIRQEYGVDAYLQAEAVHRYAWLILMLAAVLYPYVFLAARSVFLQTSRHLGEASRLLGAGPVRTFLHVFFPLMRPALVAGLFLVSMEVLSDYGASKYMGVNTLTVTIFRTWFGLDELATAKYLSAWVLLGVFGFLAFERWQRGRMRFSDRRLADMERKRCGKRGGLACIFVCVIPVTIGIVFPVGMLVSWLLVQEGELVRESLSRVGQSLGLAAVVVCICVLIGTLFSAYARFSRRQNDTRLMSAVFTAGYSTPGTVMAVGILGVAAYSRTVFPAGTWIGSWLVSGSFFWLVLALTCRYLTVSGQMLQAGFQAIPQEYDNASLALGRSRLGTFWHIHRPLLRSSFLGAAVLVFVDVSKELPLTLLLRPFDFETLGTTAYSFVNQGEIFSAAAPSLVLITLSAGCLLLVELCGWSK